MRAGRSPARKLRNCLIVGLLTCKNRPAATDLALQQPAP
jgi:hypothetical protein